MKRIPRATRVHSFGSGSSSLLACCWAAHEGVSELDVNGLGMNELGVSELEQSEKSLFPSFEEGALRPLNKMSGYLK